MKKINVELKKKGMEFNLMLAVVLFFIAMIAIISFVMLSNKEGTGISGAIGGLISGFANLIAGGR